MKPKSPEAYTDAPELPSNLILASLRLLSWLLFHPLAWRNYVGRIQPELNPNFSLITLRQADWLNPQLHPLLFSSYLIWPILIGLLIGLILGFLGVSREIIIYRMGGGALFALTIGLVCGSLGGLTFGLMSSVVGGVAAGVTGNIFLGLGIGLGFGVLRSRVAWGLAILLYPFLLAWNALLYYADDRRTPDQASLLRWHSAFWNEYQPFPLFGLDAHLVLIAERYPVEGQAAIYYLASSPQHWAAQATQIELHARQLEQCATIEAISQVHLVTSELTEPANALLYLFVRHSQEVQAARNQAPGYHRRQAFHTVEKRLDNLQRELTLSSEAYAVRFYGVATHWYQIVASYNRQLDKEAELNQEIDNPYIFGIPLTEQQEIFVGRTDIIARIEQLLLDRQRPPLLLYGQRRMGKTSLLHNLGRLLPSTTAPLFVDGEIISGADNYSDLLYSLTTEMSRSARRLNLTLPPLPLERLSDNPFTCFNEWLDGVEETMLVQGRQMALLTLDEFEALANVHNKERFDEYDFLRMLRNLIQHRPYFKLLLAGSHTLEEFRNWAGYLINIQIVEVRYLEHEEALQLIERPVKEFNLQYEPEASQRILNLTRGHPYLVQLLCYELVTLKNKQAPPTRWVVRLADIETATSAALRRGSFFFADIEQNQVNGAERDLLRFLAHHGEGIPVSQEAMVSYLGSYENLKQALVLLERHTLIEPVAEGYCFQVELIRRWFDR